MRKLVVLVAFALASSVALAGEPTVAFKYVDSAGVVSYTDDKERVPKAYKATVEKVTLKKLADYERFTKVPQVQDVFRGK